MNRSLSVASVLSSCCMVVEHILVEEEELHTVAAEEELHTVVAEEELHTVAAEVVLRSSVEVVAHHSFAGVEEHHSFAEEADQSHPSNLAVVLVLEVHGRHKDLVEVEVVHGRKYAAVVEDRGFENPVEEVDHRFLDRHTNLGPEQDLQCWNWNFHDRVAERARHVGYPHAQA
jgi:hypothetical protein